MNRSHISPPLRRAEPSTGWSRCRLGPHQPRLGLSGPHRTTARLISGPGLGHDGVHDSVHIRARLLPVFFCLLLRRVTVSNRWIASAQDAVHGDRVTTGPFGPHSVHIGSVGSHHRVHIDTRPCAWLSLVYGSLDIGSWLAHCGITRTTTGDPHSFHICGLACSPHR